MLRNLTKYIYLEFIYYLYLFMFYGRLFFYRQE